MAAMQISQVVTISPYVTPGRSVMIAALLKFIGVVGQSDIFYECPTKNITVLDQISNRKYKNIHLVYEKKQNTSDHNFA